MSDRPMQEVNSPDEVPPFATEAEEAEFWETHSLGPGMLQQMEPVPDELLPAPRSRRSHD